MNVRRVQAQMDLLGEFSRRFLERHNFLRENFWLIVSRIHFTNDEDRTPGRQVWYSYWDRCLWTEGDFWSRINYIHRNPVKHGHVATPEEWPHSSWPRFASLQPESEAALALQRFPAPRQLPHDP